MFLGFEASSAHSSTRSSQEKPDDPVLLRILKSLAALHFDVKEIKKDLINIQTAVSSSQAVLKITKFSLPVKSEEELQELEKQVSCDEKFESLVSTLRFLETD